MLPKLAAVPSINHDLVIKTSTNGITYLKEGRFTRRYTGNKYSAVDINGNLWLRASELKKHIRGPVVVRKKKPQVETQGKKLAVLPAAYQEQNYQSFSTSGTELLTAKPQLSTERTYQVNKTEVRQRLLGFINTQAGKKELYFWTVTFPAGTTDAIAYKIFNIWLTSLRQYKLLKNYLWVAERQVKNDHHTIHFHLAIPHKMPVKRANAMMAGTLATFAKRGLIPFNVYQCKRYNGVDIAKNRNTKRVTNFAIKKGSRSLANYLTKYVTKNDGKFEHLAWHNSRGYSSIFTGVTFTVDEFIKYGFVDRLDKTKKFVSQYFIFVPWAGSGPPELITGHLYKLNSFIQSQLN